jgi:hypothetical protein
MDLRQESPSSWFTIIGVIAVELVLAAAIAYAVAQAYLASECSDSDFSSENVEVCAGGFPYPLY